MWKQYSLNNFDPASLPWRRPAGEELDEGEVLALHGVTFSDAEIKQAGFDPRDDDLSFTFLTDPFRNHESGCRVIICNDTVTIEIEPHPVAWFLLSAKRLKPTRLHAVASTLRSLLARTEQARAHARSIGQLGGRPRDEKPSPAAVYKREQRAKNKARE
jgi:hypothetical protein